MPPTNLNSLLADATLLLGVVAIEQVQAGPGLNKKRHLNTLMDLLRETEICWNVWSMARR
jgi:hypothetical protein